MSADKDSPELAAARAVADKAVRAYVELRAAELDYPGAYVVGWSAFAEYTTIDFERDEQSGNMVIVPDMQAASMSRGLFEFGVDAFTRGNG